jgi:RNA polymerase sigma factor (sigma-70 family)
MNRQVNELEIEKLSHHPEFIDKDELLIWLMDEYGKQLVRLAFIYVKNEQMAEDIVQDVFEKCYLNLDGFQGRSSYKTWLYQITVNACKDKLKSWTYRNMVFVDFFSFQTESREQSTEDMILSVEENNRLSIEILSLPLKLREVIIFYYYERYKMDEIANVIGISLNTVKSRLRRGKEVLRNKLDRGDFLGR